MYTRVAKERYFFQKVFGQNCKISQKHFLYFNLSHIPFVALYVVLKTFLYHFSTIFKKSPRWLIKGISTSLRDISLSILAKNIANCHADSWLYFVVAANFNIYLSKDASPSEITDTFTDFRTNSFVLLG